jgi:putative flippase GtrA
MILPAPNQFYKSCIFKSILFMNLPDVSKIFKFGTVGCSGIIIDFSLTYLCKEKLQINKYISNAIGFSCAATSNFLLNNYWTFNENNESLVFDRFFIFFIISLAGLGINSLVIALLTKKFTLNFYISKIIAVAVVFIWNFLLNNYITFYKIK